MRESKFVEVLRSQCRYHATFAVVWLAFTLLDIYYGYAWMSAIGGFFVHRHIGKTWGAYQTAVILSGSRTIEIGDDNDKGNE